MFLWKILTLSCINQTLHRFCHYFLQSFSTEKILERHVNHCLEVNGKQMKKMDKRCESIKFKNYTRKIKSPFMIYANFESNLAPENNVKKDTDQSYTNKYQNYVECTEKLVCADEQFGKPLKSYLDQNDVHTFITNMAEESKFCSRVIKKRFNKELVMSKEGDKKFKSSTKCWTCANTFVEGDVKLRGHWHVTEKYRGAEHRAYNINVSLDYKITIVFHNLKTYDIHHIMQKLGKFDFKINIIPNKSEKYISFSFDNKLVFIDSLQLLGSI